METSLNHGLTFLAYASGLVLVIVAGFLVKLLIDLSKLTKNIDETTTIVKSEIEPTLKELNNALQSINSIAQNANKQVGSLAKLVEDVLGAGSVAFSKAKVLSGGIIKGLVKCLTLIFKLFLKK